MKKWGIILTTALLATTLIAACGKKEENTEVEEKNLTPEEALEYIHEGEQYDLTFEGYGEAGGTVKLTKVDGTTETWDGAGYIGAKGLKVGDVLAANEIEKIEAMNPEDTFEGWMEYKIILNEEEDWITEDRVRTSEELLTTEQVMERKMEDYSLVYVAKWASIPAEEYFAEEVIDIEDVVAEDSITLFANGGMMTFGAEEPYDSDLYTYYVQPGNSLKDTMNSGMEDPMNEIKKDGKVFDGWTVYVGDSVEWPDEMVDVYNAKCFAIDDFWYILVNNCKVYGENIPTEELLEIVCEDNSYYAVANWK